MKYNKLSLLPKQLNKTEQQEGGDKIGSILGLINSITYLCFLNLLRKLQIKYTLQ